MNESATLDQLASGWAEAVARAALWTPPVGSYLVVVPHPDDEALMFGGLLAHLAIRETPVHVVAVTDGDAAYPGITEGETLAAVRRAEQARAMAALGLERTTVTRLGVPDGQVASHENGVTEAVAGIIVEHRIDVVLAPWVRDHHTDHEACGRAARLAAGTARRPITLVSGLFWALLRDAAADDTRLNALELTNDERTRKIAAIERHRSQVGTTVVDEPVLGEVELSIARWAREHVMIDIVDGAGS